MRAGAAALLAAFISVWSFWIFLGIRKIKHFFDGAIYFAISISFLNFSAVLSWYVGILAILFYRKKYAALTLLVAPIVPLFSASIYWLNQNMDVVIFGKPGAAFLIGSGRFIVYELSLKAYTGLDFLQQLTGLGYMAEREILTGLQVPWGADLHQSALSALIGLGPIGLILYILFVFKPFSRIFTIRGFASRPGVIFMFLLHCMFTTYGITSSGFFYQPSLILLIYLYCLSCLTGAYKRKIW